MADFLTIAGKPYPTQTTNAQQNETAYVGEKVRSFNNTQRSTRDAATKKRSWTFSLGPLTQAAYLALRADVDGDAIVACGGDALGAAVNCMVDVTSAAYVADNLSFLRVAVVTLEEA